MIRMIFGKLHRNNWHIDWHSKKVELDINFALSIHLATIFLSDGRGLCFMHVIGTNKNEGEDLLLLILTLTRTCTNVSCRILQ